MMGYNFGFGSVWGMLLMALLSVGIIGLVIWLVSKVFNGSANTTTVGTAAVPLPASPSASASELLKQRYARGEITKEQFEEMRRGIEA